MYIAIAGNIGSGKTYLTELLSERLGWEARYEEPENPYLGDFYNQMQRWSFNLQIYFLGKRLRQLAEITESPRPAVVDRTIYEDARVFASNLHAMGLLAKRDYATYMQLYELIDRSLTPPRLLIYLKASAPNLISQIKRRGRVYESSIDAAYLSNLNTLYDEWVDSYTGPKLVIEVDRQDFVTDPVAREAVLERIVRRLDE